MHLCISRVCVRGVEATDIGTYWSSPKAGVGQMSILNFELHDTLVTLIDLKHIMALEKKRRGHKWVPKEARKDKPIVFPRCKSPCWHTPRRQK